MRVCFASAVCVRLDIWVRLFASVQTDTNPKYAGHGVGRGVGRMVCLAGRPLLPPTSHDMLERFGYMGHSPRRSQRQFDEACLRHITFWHIITKPPMGTAAELEADSMRTDSAKLDPVSSVSSFPFEDALLLC